MFYNVFLQRVFWLYFLGLSLTTFSVLHSLVNEITRKKINLYWLFLSAFFLGFSKLISSLGPNLYGVEHFIIVFFEISACTSLWELTRTNLKQIYPNLPFTYRFHFFTVVFSLAIFNVFGQYSWQWSFYSALLLLLSMLVCLRVSKTSSLRRGESINYIFFFLILFATVQILAAFVRQACVFYHGFEEYTGLCYVILLQIIIVNILNFIILFSKLVLRSQCYWSGRKISNCSSGILIFLLLLLVNLAFFPLSSFVESQKIATSQAELTRNAESLSKTINQRLLFANISSSLIAKSPIVLNYLLEPTDDGFESLNSVLQSFAQGLSDGICFIVNNDGLIVASSRCYEKLHLKSVDFTNYFISGIRGLSTSHIDFANYFDGLVYYSSNPVINEQTGEVLGVCVIERGLSDLTEYFDLYNPAFVIDDNEVIRFASDEKLIGKDFRMVFPEKNLEGRAEQAFLNESVYIFPRNKYYYQFLPLDLKDWYLLLLHQPERQGFAEKNLMPIILLSSLVLITILFGQCNSCELITKINAAQNQFESVFFNAPESIFVIETKTLNILAANNSMMQKFGFNASPVGHNFKELLPEGGIKITAFKYFSDSKIISHERDFRRVSGDVFTAQVTITRSLFDNKDSLIFLLHDISAIRLTELNLRRAKENAEQTSRLKSRFLANASHVLRTPMTAIIGLTDLACSQSISHNQLKILNLIRASSKSLLDLVNDIFDLSAIDLGKLAVEKKSFNLRLVLKKLYEVLALEAKEKNLKLVLSVAPEVPEQIASDPRLLRQILFNLLTNSLKFTQKGKVELFVTLKKTTESKKMLEFLLVDEGIKISESSKSKMFSAFAYDHIRQSDNERASGLSLIICREVVNLMGGEISLEFSTEQATSFKILLPFELADSDFETEADLLSEEQYYKLYIDSRPMKFLVVDDNETNLFLAKSLIETCEGTCVAVKSGFDAIDVLNTETFDIVMLDIQMPDISGIETLKIIRKTNQVPVVAVSAFSGEEDRNRAILAGANLYLNKPYFVSTFFEAIKKVLSIEKFERLIIPFELNSEEETESVLPTDIVLLDIKELKSRVLNKPENILHISEIYSKRLKELCTDIDLAITKQSYTKLAELAHSLKGLVGMLAAKKTFELSKKFEDLAKEQNTKEIEHLLPNLKQQLHKIEEELLILSKNTFS